MSSPLDSPHPEENLSQHINDGLECLDRHQLAEASQHFQAILSTLGPWGGAGQEKVFVQALTGLAEVHFRKARSCRADDLEWHHQMLQSSALESEVMEVCRRLEERTKDLEERERRKWYWTEDYRKKSTQQLGVINKFFLETFQQRMGAADSTATKYKVAYQQKSLTDDTRWLDKLDIYIGQQDIIARNQKLLLGNNNETTTEVLPVITDQTVSEDATSSEKPSVKVDCGQVQNAIMKLVRQISSDMRQRYVRKKLPEEMFRRSVSSEMIAQFAPMPDSRDILSMFENAIIKYKYGMTCEEFQDYYADRMAAEHDLTDDEVGSDNLSDDGDPGSPRDASFEHDQSPDTDDRKILLSLEDASFKLTGVITIWKAHGRTGGTPRRSRKYIKPYLLQGFEEVSPLTETRLLSSDFGTPQDTMTSSTEDILSENSSVSTVHMSSEQYITERKLKHTLALTSIQCAEQFQKNSTLLSQASELYIHALGILQKDQSISADHRNLRAHILKNLGVIRCSQGNICIGSQLMHESIELYSSEESMDNIKVAEVLFALGDMYMTDHWKDDCISEHMMNLVKNRLDREVGVCNDDEDCPDDASIDSDLSDEEGEAYNVCAYEAIGCYESALAILGKLRKRKEVHTSLYVDVLTKLGDCSIVTGEFERAVLCYEEALYLCQDTLGSVSLTNSAHILSMLGTTNFLLGTHSKAATMYQTAHILQQHLYGLLDNFEMAITLTMQGITYFEMKLYHKCIAMCIKAFDLYKNIYKDDITSVRLLHRWFIVQTLYLAGCSYSTVGLSDKALNYLELAQKMVHCAKEEDFDIHQQVRILKCIADIYATLEMNSTALEYYQQALDHSVKLGDEQSANTLHNQLLNRMAGVLVCTKEYGAAADYLEQALDCQRNVETSIKGDLIGTLQALGRTYTLSGDMQRAIECYNECHDAYKEAEVASGPDIAKTLCSLGTLYHVKGCMQDDNDEMMEYLDSCDQYYRQGIGMDPESSVCVHYGNFLYQQGQYADALLEMLSYVFLWKPAEVEIEYNGPEQAVLPEHLLNDLDHMDEVSLDARVFARFLGVLCLKQLGLVRDAEDCLVGMVRVVHSTKNSINYSMLGYALLEMELYLEAAESFSIASDLQHDNGNAFFNQWICVCLHSYTILTKAVINIWVLATEAYFDLQYVVTTARVVPSESSSYEYQYLEYQLSGSAEVTSPQQSYTMKSEPVSNLGSPGYDYSTLESGVDEWVVEEEVTLDAPAEILNALNREKSGESQYRYSTYSERDTQAETKTRNIYDIQNTESEKESQDVYKDQEIQEEVWVTEEETVDTPAEVLLSLQNNNTFNSGPSVTQRDVQWSSRSDANGNGNQKCYQQSTTVESSYLQHSYSRSDQRRPWYRDYDSLNGNAGERFRDSSSAAVTSAVEESGMEEEEQWMTIEEVVDTPAELLQAILANQKL